MVRAIACVLAAGALCVLTASAAGSQPSLDGEQAVTSARFKTCGSLRTANGGRALSVAVVGVRCKRARRIARRADGAGFRAAGFTCRLRKKRRALPGRLYGCRPTTGGRRGVGFLYRRA